MSQDRACAGRNVDVQLYLDGRMSAAAATAFEDHLATCSACRADLDALLALDELVRGLPIVAEPVDFTQQVLVRVPAAAPPPPFRLGALELIGAIALAALAALALGVGAALVGGSALELADPTRTLELYVFDGVAPVWVGVVQAAVWAAVGLLVALALQAARRLWSG